MMMTRSLRVWKLKNYDEKSGFPPRFKSYLYLSCLELEFTWSLLAIAAYMGLSDLVLRVSGYGIVEFRL